MPWIARGAVRLLPAAEREAVMGDLAEEGLHPGSLAWLVAVMDVALQFQLEGWRDPSARIGVLLALATGFMLWLAITSAAFASAPELVRSPDPLSRLALRFWAAPHLPAALATGLVIGHAPWIPPFARAARWHAVGAFAVVTVLSAPTGTRPWALVLLLGSAWLGERGGRDLAVA